MSIKKIRIICTIILLLFVFTNKPFNTSALNNDLELEENTDVIQKISAKCYHTTLYEFDDATMTINGIYHGNKIEDLLNSIEVYNKNERAVVYKNGKAIYFGELEVGMTVKVYHGDKLYGEYFIKELLNPFDISLKPNGESLLTNTTNSNTYDFILPIDNIILTSQNEDGNISDFYHINHEAIDIARGTIAYSNGILGAPIRAIKGGTVIVSNFHSSYGNYVKIDHGSGIQTIYAHMRDWPIYPAGTILTQGTIIGYVGSTGASTGPHLHLELIINGVKVDPLPYLSGAVNGDNLANPPDGTFVRVTDTGEVYRIAGGAPIYVTSWESVGGNAVPIDISQSQLNEYNQYPIDGTCVASPVSGNVYVFAGGAPIQISSFSNIPAVSNIIYVDESVLNGNANYGNNHIRQYPENGTSVVGSSGSVYIFAGGAPIPLTSFNKIPTVNNLTYVDETVLCGNLNYGNNHIRLYPLDGTRVVGLSGSVYIFAGGASIPLSSFNNIPESNDLTYIDETVINGIIGYNNNNHIRQYPLDGTWVKNISEVIYIFAGGAPIKVYSTNNLSQIKNATYIDGTVLEGNLNYGNGHLREYPLDNTYVKTKNNTVFKFFDNKVTNIYSKHQALDYPLATEVDMFYKYQADSFDEAYILEIDVNNINTVGLNLTSPSKSDIIKFSVPISGNYLIYSSNSVGDLYGELYDDNYNMLISDDDSAGELNYEISYYLTAGEVYYILTRNYSSSAFVYGDYELNIMTY